MILFTVLILGNFISNAQKVPSTPSHSQSFSLKPFNFQLLDSSSLKKIGQNYWVANAYLDRMPVVLPQGKQNMPVLRTDSSTMDDMPNLWNRKDLKTDPKPLPNYQLRPPAVKKLK